MYIPGRKRSKKGREGGQNKVETGKQKNNLVYRGYPKGQKLPSKVEKTGKNFKKKVIRKTGSERTVPSKIPRSRKGKESQGGDGGGGTEPVTQKQHKEVKNKGRRGKSKAESKEKKAKPFIAGMKRGDTGRNKREGKGPRWARQGGAPPGKKGALGKGGKR